MEISAVLKWNQRYEMSKYSGSQYSPYPHHPEGDFFLARGSLHNHPTGVNCSKLTFSGLGIYRPELFAQCKPGRFPLAPLLRAHVDRGRISGERYRGKWLDIGTPERLNVLDAMLIS